MSVAAVATAAHPYFFSSMEDDEELLLEFPGKKTIRFAVTSNAASLQSKNIDIIT
jgi:hypothetical protein